MVPGSSPGGPTKFIFLIFQQVFAKDIFLFQLSLFYLIQQLFFFRFFEAKNEIMPIDDVSNVIHKFEKVTNIEKKETVNQKNIKPKTIIF